MSGHWPGRELGSIDISMYRSRSFECSPITTGEGDAGPRAGNDRGCSLTVAARGGGEDGGVSGVERRAGGGDEDVPEEMEYSTWRDIGQTRSHSAKMMASWKLDDIGGDGGRVAALDPRGWIPAAKLEPSALDIPWSMRGSWQLTRR